MKLNKINNIVYSFEICLYVFISIVGAANFIVFSNEQINEEKNYVNIFLIFLLVISFIFNLFFYKLTKRKFIFILISIPLMLLTFYFSGFALLLPYLFILAFPINLDLNTLFKYLYRTILVSVLLIIGFYFLGICNDTIGFRENGSLRHSFGFSTPNTLANFVLTLYLTRLLAYIQNWKKRDTIIWLIVLCIVYFYTRSRMSFIIELFVTLVVIIYKRKLLSKSMLQNVYSLPSIIFVINTCVSLLAVNFIQNQAGLLFNTFNKLTSGRLYFMISFYRQYGLSLFGNKNIKFITADQVRASNNLLQWSGVDNSYIYISMLYGMMMLLAFFIMFIFAGKYLKNMNFFMGTLYLLAITIIGLTENYMSSIAMNFMFFFFAKYLNNMNVGNIGTDVERHSI